MKNPKFHEGDIVTFFDGLTRKSLGGQGVVTRLSFDELYRVSRNGKDLGWFSPKELKLKECG